MVSAVTQAGTRVLQLQVRTWKPRAFVSAETGSLLNLIFCNRAYLLLPFYCQQVCHHDPVPCPGRFRRRLRLHRVPFPHTFTEHQGLRTRHLRTFQPRTRRAHTIDARLGSRQQGDHAPQPNRLGSPAAGRGATHLPSLPRCPALLRLGLHRRLAVVGLPPPRLRHHIRLPYRRRLGHLRLPLLPPAHLQRRWVGVGTPQPRQSFLGRRGEL